MTELTASRSPVGDGSLPERETIGLDADVCALSSRWSVDEETMARVVLSAWDYEEETRLPVTLISGYRTRREQRRLGQAGRPAARDDLSTHRSCPATGVDVSLGLAPTRVQKAIWGRIVTLNGLRWGGGGRVDDGGIPLDWGHVDRGPRL